MIKEEKPPLRVPFHLTPTGDPPEIEFAFPECPTRNPPDLKALRRIDLLRQTVLSNSNRTHYRYFPSVDIFLEKNANRKPWSGDKRDLQVMTLIIILSQGRTFHSCFPVSIYVIFLCEQIAEVIPS